MTIQVDVSGDYACFTRPELHVERVSYPCITPSAARGLIESVFWHPGLSWQVDRILVLNEIDYIDIRRNEVKSKALRTTAASAMKGGKKEIGISASDDIQQRASRVLRNVHYIINYHFEMTDKASPSDNPGKFQDIAKRRLRKGQCFHQGYLGCREFPARLELSEGSAAESAYAGETVDLGYMLYDLDYTNRENIEPMFFHAMMRGGIIDVAGCEVLR